METCFSDLLMAVWVSFENPQYSLYAQYDSKQIINTCG